jgi:hypothetical protein
MTDLSTGQERVCFLCGRKLDANEDGHAYLEPQIDERGRHVLGVVLWVHVECHRVVVLKNRQRYRCEQAQFHYTSDDCDAYQRTVLKIVQLSRQGRGVREIARLLSINKNRVTRTLQCWRALSPIPVSQSLPINW